MVTYIYIGTPSDTMLGRVHRIQINDAFAEVGNIGAYVETERASMPEQNKNKMITSLKIDKDTRMGLVTDVKQELRKANALNINYSSKK